MHLYTLVQVAGLVLLYAVKSSRFSLALPFFLVMMVPLRMALVFLFTPLQLRAVRYLSFSHLFPTAFHVFFRIPKSNGNFDLSWSPVYLWCM